MKARKTFLALLLVLCLMMSLFVSCANNEQTPDTSKDPGTTSKPDTNVTETDDGEVVPLVLWYNSSQNIEGQDEVEAKLNEITEKEINVHVDLQVFETGQYASAASLALSSGETVDVFMRSFGPMSFATLYGQKQLLNIEPYMEEYGAGMQELFGDLLNCFRMDGGLYAVPPYRVMNQTAYIGMRRDILEDMGMIEFADKMTTWTEFEELMFAIKDRYEGEGLYPIALAAIMADTLAFGSDSFADAFSFDFVGDPTKTIYATEDGEFGRLMWNEDLIKQYERHAKWYNSGLVWLDSPHTDMMASDGVKLGVAVGEIFSAELGVETQKRVNTGYDYYVKPILSMQMCSDNVNKFGMGININTDYPEASVKLLNLIHTDPEVMNLLIFGIEGKHYVVNDEGMADYPVSGEPTSSNYHLDEFFLGNQFLLKPWAGQGADYRETSLEYFKGGSVSAYLGFALDTSDLADTVAALSAVTDQYSQAINTGLYTPQMLAEYQQKLEVAGIDAYLEEIQKQVTAWKK